MLRLVFEAVMVIAVVSCLYFVMKMGQIDISENESPSENDKGPKDD